MEIKNRDQLLEFIRKQSLKLISENGAFASLEDKVQSIDESFIEVYQKKLDKLNAAEEKAMGEENYVELQKIKTEKLETLKKLIDAFKYKTNILEKMHSNLALELNQMDSKGTGVFKDKPLNEFDNERLEKGTSLKINTLSSEIKVQKISDNNQYQVLNSTASGIDAGDILAFPNMKVGHSAQIHVYRKIGDRFQQIGSPKLDVIKGITKNPS